MSTEFSSSPQMLVLEVEVPGPKGDRGESTVEAQAAALEAAGSADRAAAAAVDNTLFILLGA